MSRPVAGSPITASTRRLLNPPNDNSSPVIICFHGSGESCSPSWDVLASELSKTYHVLLLDRSSGHFTPSDFEATLPGVVHDIPPPYVLIAHSYGGAFARCFLHARPNDVAGMVMVETGQETVWDAEIEQRQYSQQALGSKPLSVIRGNSLIMKFKELESLELDSQILDTRRKVLEQWNAEDERLKIAQLALSTNHRYVHLPNCGHNVIRDRPDVVVEEVKWVMQNLNVAEQIQRAEPVQTTIKLMFARLKGFVGRSTDRV